MARKNSPRQTPAAGTNSPAVSQRRVEPVSGEGVSMGTAKETVDSLFLRYANSIRGYIRALVPHGPDAEEIFQETFIAIREKADDYDPERPFLPWVYRFAHYKVLAWVRDKGRQRQSALPPEAVDRLTETIARSKPLEDELEALRQCFAKLTPAAQRVLRRFYLESASAGEIAREMEIKVKSIYVALDRARLRIRRCIQHELGAGKE